MQRHGEQMSVRVHVTSSLQRSRDAGARALTRQLSPRLQFKFDGVLQNASQDAVYESVGAEAVEAVLQGYHSTVSTFASQQSPEPIL